MSLIRLVQAIKTISENKTEDQQTTAIAEQVRAGGVSEDLIHFVLDPAEFAVTGKKLGFNGVLRNIFRCKFRYGVAVVSEAA